MVNHKIRGSAVTLLQGKVSYPLEFRYYCEHGYTIYKYVRSPYSVMYSYIPYMRYGVVYGVKAKARCHLSGTPVRQS